MNEKITKLSDNLFLFCDTCNVYVIRDGDRGLLIDSGSGNILDNLDQLGISQIDWVLHTHHHRDQCWGDHRLVERGAKIAAPEFEHYLFTEAERFWQNRRI